MHGGEKLLDKCFYAVFYILLTEDGSVRLFIELIYLTGDVVKLLFPQYQLTFDTGTLFGIEQRAHRAHHGALALYKLLELIVASA